jgi:hypothetical protein
VIVDDWAPILGLNWSEYVEMIVDETDDELRRMVRLFDAPATSEDADRQRDDLFGMFGSGWEALAADEIGMVDDASMLQGQMLRQVIAGFMKAELRRRERR